MAEAILILTLIFDDSNFDFIVRLSFFFQKSYGVYFNPAAAQSQSMISPPLCLTVGDLFLHLNNVHSLCFNFSIRETLLYSSIQLLTTWVSLMCWGRPSLSR